MEGSYLGMRKERILWMDVGCRLCVVDVSVDPVKSFGMSSLLGKTWFLNMGVVRKSFENRSSSLRWFFEPGATGQRLEETKKINQSLSALGLFASQ